MSCVGLRLGEILDRLGLITGEQLRKALEIQKRSGKRLGEILIEQNLLTEEEFATAMALQKGLPVVNLNEYQINMQAVNVVSESLAQKHRMLPIDFHEGELVLAMANPLDLHGIDNVSLLSKSDVRVVVATESQIKQSINRYLSDEGMIKEAADRTEPSAFDIEEAQDALDNTPIVRLANQIILQAVERGASDVHIEPQEHQVNIRYRIDGVMQKAMTVPRKVQPSLISRLKIMGTLDIAEHRIPQDGGHNLKIGSENVDLRIATIPTIHGENISIRIHHKERGMLQLEEVGFQPEALEKYQISCTKPYGTILVTGPTGCGKSTTLYATLRILNSIAKKVFTVEDPVEYSLPGLIQVQVNPKVGLNFASALRSIVRCDPDILMIGEIRDKETAKIAVESALTGHLVFSTLHTNDASSALTRLIEMGIEPFLVASSIDCVVAQRLARKLCPYCKEPYEPSKGALKRLGFPDESENVTIYKAKGCNKCYNTGYRGRIGLFEVMAVSNKIARLCQESISSEGIREVALREGMQSMCEDGLRKVKAGITSIEEVMKVVF
jgi:type IV pilus assembly protein PilB